MLLDIPPVCGKNLGDGQRCPENIFNNIIFCTLYIHFQDINVLVSKTLHYSGQTVNRKFVSFQACIPITFGITYF